MNNLSPSEALVEVMAKNKVENVFGIVGSAYMDALDLFPEAGIRFIPTVHEQGAAHMADGYSRIKGTHGVCIAQNGPGITNFVTGIAAAYWAHSPVVAITPETGSNSIGLGGFQETEQMPIFSKITKFQTNVSLPQRMAELSARCFDMALMERGPVQLNIPRNNFYGDFQGVVPEPKRIEFGSGGKASIKKAIEILRKAEFPVIVSGGGIVLDDAFEEIIAFAEAISAPVVNSYLHNDSFPASHPLWCGPLGYQGSKAGMKLLKKADVVLALGTRLGPFGTLPQHGIEYWPTNAKIIQVDIDYKVLGLVREIAVGIYGSPKAIIEELTKLVGNEELACKANKASRLEVIKQEKDEWESELDNWLGEKDDWSEKIRGEGGISPRQVLRELEKSMPEDVMVSTDIGNICSVSNSYLRFEKPRSFLAAMSFGNCGYAFPAVIGAKVAAPERPAVAYVGDGAWGMSFGEILTCVREQIPVTAVVFHNRQWGAEKKNQVDFYGKRFLGSNLENPKFCEIAKSMGAEGIYVEEKDQIGDAFKQSISNQKEGKTTILEIFCSRELGDPFRRDALKMPVRNLDKYKKYVNH